VLGIEALRAALEALKPGEPVVLQVQRGAELRFVTVAPE